MSVEYRPQFLTDRENKRINLSSVVLDRLPNLYEFPHIGHDDLTVLANPTSFDELLENKRGFQEYKVVLKRKPEVQKSLDRNLQMSAQLGYSPLETYLDMYLKKEQFLLTLNRFPYNVPDDTRHLIAWYRANTTAVDLSQFLADKFDEYTIGENDFVFYRNLPTRMSVPDIDHLHILVRR